MYVLVASPCFASTFRVVMNFLFSLSVRLIRLGGNSLGFFVQVAGPLPLPALFFGSFLAYSGTLPFAFLAADAFEVSRVFPMLA
jgi:hypothetical protein